jgi:predicted HAD superfamily Cof-like phosphohydrolase
VLDQPNRAGGSTAPDQPTRAGGSTAPDQPTRAGGSTAPDQPNRAGGASGRSRISRQVEDFHRAYQLEAAEVPTVVGPELARLRQALIDEEVEELRAAAASADVVEIADALADIVYVAYGTARVYGIDLDAVLDEVHSSNMTKLGADGRPVRRADGKVLKGPGYRPPDIARVLGVSPAGPM